MVICLQIFSEVSDYRHEEAHHIRIIGRGRVIWAFWIYWLSVYIMLDSLVLQDIVPEVHQQQAQPVFTTSIRTTSQVGVPVFTDQFPVSSCQELSAEPFVLAKLQPNGIPHNAIFDILSIFSGGTMVILSGHPCLHGSLGILNFVSDYFTKEIVGVFAPLK